MPRQGSVGVVAARTILLLVLLMTCRVAPVGGVDSRAGATVPPWSAPPGLVGVEQTPARLVVEYDPEKAPPGPLHMSLTVPSGMQALARWLHPAGGGALSIEWLGHLRFARLARLTVVPPTGMTAPRRFEVRFIADDRAAAASGSARESPRPLPEDASTVSWRLQVPSTDLWSVPYADLAAQGFPAGLPVTALELVERSSRDRSGVVSERPVPIVVEEGGGEAGVFDEGDQLLFYGLDRRDRYQPAPADDRYARHHNYWLRAGEAGARMPDVRAIPVDGETTPRAFVDVVRREEDRVYSSSPPPLGGEPLPRRPTHFWTGPFGDTESFLVFTPGTASGGFARVRAWWRGEFGHTHHVSLAWVGACPVGADTLLLAGGQFFGTEEFHWDSGRTIPTARLADGCNAVRIVGRGFPDGRPDRPGAGAYFDRFEVEYPRRYRLDGGRLRATTAGARGAVALLIEGFPRPEALAFDVTDSLAPLRFDLRPDDFVRAPGGPGAGWNLTLRLTADRQRTVLVLLPESVRRLAGTAATLPLALRPGPVVREEPRDLASDSGADVIVVTPSAFRPALEAWMARRTAQGRKILVVSPQDVWNFMSGGDKSVPALRDWLRLLFRTWVVPPSDLLLLGDASEDYGGSAGGSAPDWVPTMMLYGPVPGRDQRRELIGSDRWFVGSLHPDDSDNDVLPDMHVGRLPAGSLAEAAALLEKSALFEEADPEASWRRKVSLFSDDAYSSDYTMTAGYCFRPEERLFEAGADTLAALLAAADCNADFDVTHLRVREDLDAAPHLERSGVPGSCPPPTPARNEARRVIRPRWLEDLAGGAFLHAYSGHANRNVLTGEQVVEFSGHFTSPENRTTEQLENWGRPFIFLGLGCHIAEYEAQAEERAGESLAESLLLLPGRGAVAAVASTGYEQLAANPVLQRYLGQALLLRAAPFAGPPTVGGELPRRRTLGESVDRGLVQALVEAGGGASAAGLFQGTLRSYTLLGDPTLRLDGAPPDIERFVDGAPLPDGAPVIAADASGEVELALRVTEDVDWTAVDIVDDGTRHPVPDGAVVTEPDTTESCRRGWLRYRTHLAPAEYVIRLAIAEWSGTEVIAEFPIRLRVEWRHEGRPLETGTRLYPEDQVTVEVELPLPIDASRLDVDAGGVAHRAHWTALDTGGRHWSATLPLGDESGSVTLRLLVDGAPARAQDAERTLHVDAAPRIDRAWFGPSPWSGGPAWFGYRLRFGEGRAPDRVMIRIFSISGRPVARLTGPGTPGEVVVPWDVRDDTGAPLANGVYLFRVGVDGDEDAQAPPPGRLVLLR